MAIVYGPDAFTVGSDTELSAYNSDWSQIDGSPGFTINATSDRIRFNGTSDDIAYIWSGTGSPTGDQKISWDYVNNANNAETEFGGVVRGSVGTGGTYYLGVVVAQYATSSIMKLYRIVNGSFTTLTSATISELSTSTTYACSLQAITNGSQVDLTLAVAGQTDLTYSDTNAARLTSGVCGLGGYAPGGAFLDDKEIDNVQIESLAAGAATLEQEGCRIRNDDGSESSASWKAAQDTAVSMTLGAARVRVLLDATNDPASKAVGLKYAVNGGQKRSVN